jgi:D-alanyl-D-alanine carboxypeptidase
MKRSDWAFALRQALEALLLPSANNVAVLLAVHEASAVVP